MPDIEAEDIIDPLLDTGKAARLAMEEAHKAYLVMLEMLKRDDEHTAHEARMEELGKTIDLSAANSARLIADLKSAWDAEHKTRHSFLQVLRNLAKKFAGDMDEYVLKK